MSADIVRRTFAADLTPGEGRTIDCRIVAYGEQIEHNDGLGDVPMGVVYREEWAHGTFTHQQKAANRVLANVEHEEGVAGIVGHGLALREDTDGLYGSFKIHDTPTGNTALTLIKEGVLNTVSLEARIMKSVKTHAGVIRRVKANLQAVAFARHGAYPSAVVLAVREPQTLDSELEVEELPERLRPFDMPPELVQRCHDLGIELPERYEAHPDMDPPEASGTSDTAPAETTDN